MFVTGTVKVSIVLTMPFLCAAQKPQRPEMDESTLSKND